LINRAKDFLELACKGMQRQDLGVWKDLMTENFSGLRLRQLHLALLVVKLRTLPLVKSIIKWLVIKALLKRTH
jgi:hypothetical protein